MCSIRHADSLPSRNRECVKCWVVVGLPGHTIHPQCIHADDTVCSCLQPWTWKKKDGKGTWQAYWSCILGPTKSSVAACFFNVQTTAITHKWNAVASYLVLCVKYPTNWSVFVLLLPLLLVIDVNGLVRKAGRRNTDEWQQKTQERVNSSGRMSVCWEHFTKTKRCIMHTKKTGCESAKLTN